MDEHVRGALLDRAPRSAVDSFAGVGNPHERSHLKPGMHLLDLGSRAGLDGIIAAWSVGPGGSVIGVDLNPAMCARARNPSTRNSAGAWGVNAVLFTAEARGP